MFRRRAGHDGRVVRHGILGFDLIGPPIGKRRRARAVRGNLLRDLVALQHVLERCDLEAHLFRHANQHQDLVGTIAVRVHEPLALEHLDERLELQVALGRNDVLARGLLLVVRLPGLLIRLRARERVTNHVLDTHPRDRIPARPGLAELAHVLRILAEGELDARRRSLEDEVLGARLPPPQLDHLILAANRVGASVEHVGRRQAASQIAIDVDVGGVEDVAHPRHGTDGRAALVDRVVADVRVAVDQAWRDESSGHVNGLGVGRDGDVRADRGHHAVAQENSADRDRPLRDRENRSASKVDAVMTAEPHLRAATRRESSQRRRSTGQDVGSARLPPEQEPVTENGNCSTIPPCVERS